MGMPEIKNNRRHPAFVSLRRPLVSDLWFQRLAGFPLRDLSVRDFLCAGDDVLLARGSALSFCSSSPLKNLSPRR